jgi:glucose/arabinose dehydrogenase/endonuclease YncB( thermonuclease family)
MARTKTSGRPLAAIGLLAALVAIAWLLGPGLAPGSPAPSSAQAQQAEGVPPGGAPPPGSGPRDTPDFIRVIDGDTVEVWLDGKQVGVGLIGIDAPQGNTPCGKEATALLRQLARGKWHLEEDPDPALAFDDRMRRMYHATTADGRSVAEELVGAGVARADGKGKDAQHRQDDEARARAAGKGCLWRGGAGGAAQSAGDAPDTAEAPPEAAGEAALPAGGPRGLAFPLELLGAPAPAPAALPSGFLQEVLATGLVEPTSFAFLPDGRILIAEKRGVVKVLKGGQLLATPFLDLQDRVNDYWDRGLLGITADPSFATNGFVYLAYTYEEDPALYDRTKTARLARYTAVGDTASPGSEVVILGKTVGASCNAFPKGTDCLPSDSPSHTVGNARFAPDGTLFVTTGDGAHFNTVDVDALRSQDLDLLGGKVLHVTRDGAGLSTNPYWTGAAGDNRSKVWASGLRNPYRFSLRPGTNVPYLGDVGWSLWEEVDAAVRGANLGWPCYEGDNRQDGYSPYAACQTLYAQGAGAVRRPLIPIYHELGSSAVTGGVFYTGTAFPAPYQGAYFYGNYVLSNLRTLRADAADTLVPGSDADFATGVDGPVAIDAGADGSLYYVAIQTGELRRLRYAPGQPTPTPGPFTPVRVNAGGGTYLGIGGRLWAADSGFVGGSTYATGAPIAGTNDGTLYQTERWGDFTWAAAVPNGTYAVTLKFAEIYHTAPGARRFNVDVEGQRVLAGFDILAETAPNTALDKTFTVSVTDGRLDVAFSTVVNAAKVSAIEVVAAPQGGPTSTPVPNQPPVPSISAPPATLQPRVGDVVSYSGSATDPEDGPLPGTSLSWRILLHHCPGGTCHLHILTTATGAGGSFTVPDHGDDTYYEVVLTATDSAGLTGTASVIIQPVTVQITLNTTPAGLQLVYDGVSGPAPLTRRTIVGSTHTFYAPSPQGSLGFAAWSDGGAQQHQVVVGATDLTLTASFAPLPTATPTTTGPPPPTATPTSTGVPPPTATRTPAGATATPTPTPAGATATPTVPAGPAGLKGEYYDNADLTGLVLTRVDPQVDFAWGAGSPDPRVGPDTFSVRWTGWVQAERAEAYTFFTTSNDGVRLWVDGRLLVDDWTDHAPTEDAGTLALQPGWYAVRLEYYEGVGTSTISLAYSSPGTPKQTIPSARLRAGAG